MEFNLPVSGDEFENVYDGKIIQIIKIQKILAGVQLIVLPLNGMNIGKEYPVSEKQFKKEIGFKSWQKINKFASCDLP